MKTLSLIALAALASACAQLPLPDGAKKTSPDVAYKVENMRTSFADNYMCIKYTKVGRNDYDWAGVDMAECHKNGVK